MLQLLLKYDASFTTEVTNASIHGGKGRLDEDFRLWVELRTLQNFKIINKQLNNDCIGNFIHLIVWVEMICKYVHRVYSLVILN